MNQFEVWHYFQPIGHSKSSAVRSGSAPHVKKWAFALIKDGVVMRSNCVSGFATREDAEAAARNALAKVTL